MATFPGCFSSAELSSLFLLNIKPFPCSKERHSPHTAEYKEQKKRDKQRLEKEKKEQREREKKENEMKKKFKVSQAVRLLEG